MRRSRFTEQRIAYALRLAEKGAPAVEVCRKLGYPSRPFTPGRRSTPGWGSRSSAGSNSWRKRTGRSRTGCGSEPRQADAAGRSVKRALKPVRKRETVQTLTGQYGVSSRRACGLVQLHRSTFYYVSHRPG